MEGGKNIKRFKSIFCQIGVERKWMIIKCNVNVKQYVIRCLNNVGFVEINRYKMKKIIKKIVKIMKYQPNYNMLQLLGFGLILIGLDTLILILGIVYKPNLIQPLNILLSNSVGYIFIGIVLYFSGKQFKKGGSK